MCSLKDDFRNTNELSTIHNSCRGDLLHKSNQWFDDYLSQYGDILETTDFGYHGRSVKGVWEKSKIRNGKRTLIMRLRKPIPHEHHLSGGAVSVQQHDVTAVDELLGNPFAGAK